MRKRSRSSQPFLKLLRPPRPIDEVLSTIPSASSWILGLLRAVDDEVPGSVERAIDRVPLITRAHLDSSNVQGSDPYSTLVTSIIDAVDPKMQLVRVSLHAPRGADRELAPLMHTFAGGLAERGEGHGALLAIDRRDDGSEHVYGIVCCSEKTRHTLIAMWCKLTGANARAHRGRAALVSISGWHHHAMTGDRSLLEPNLRRVMAYLFHELPRGDVRDLHDVVATGALAGHESALLGLGTPSGAPTPSERLGGYRLAVPRTCDVCGRPIPKRKRADAKTCSDTCRMQKRNRKTHRSN